MSRGMHLGYPKKLDLSSTICSFAFDGRRYVWVFTADNKVHKVDWFSIPTQYNGTDVEQNWELAKVETIDFGYAGYNAVTLGDFIWVSTAKEDYTKLVRFNFVTGEKTEVPLPQAMKSNIFYSNSQIWMVSALVKDDVNDMHKLYRMNINTFAYNTTTMPGKKQNESFQIWGNYVSNLIYVSLWTNFEFAVFSNSTGNLQGTYRVNGFPGTGVNDGYNLYVSSFAGMLSKVEWQTQTITSNWSTEAYAEWLAIEYESDYIWFVDDSGKLGRVNLTTKEINVVGSGEDHNLLNVCDANSVNNSYVLKPKYDAIPASGYTMMKSTPKFSINLINSSNQEVQFTVYSRIIASVGSTLVCLNTNGIEFVFDKPEEKYSFISATGSAMLGSGDTSYIGEFL